MTRERSEQLALEQEPRLSSAEYTPPSRDDLLLMLSIAILTGFSEGMDRAIAIMKGANT